MGIRVFLLLLIFAHSSFAADCCVKENISVKQFLNKSYKQLEKLLRNLKPLDAQQGSPPDSSSSNVSPQRVSPARLSPRASSPLRQNDVESDDNMDMRQLITKLKRESLKQLSLMFKVDQIILKDAMSGMHELALIKNHYAPMNKSFIALHYQSVIKFLRHDNVKKTAEFKEIGDVLENLWEQTSDIANPEEEKISYIPKNDNQLDTVVSLESLHPVYEKLLEELFGYLYSKFIEDTKEKQRHYVVSDSRQQIKALKDARNEYWEEVFGVKDPKKYKQLIPQILDFLHYLAHRSKLDQHGIKRLKESLDNTEQLLLLFIGNDHMSKNAPVVKARFEQDLKHVKILQEKYILLSPKYVPRIIVQEVSYDYAQKMKNDLMTSLIYPTEEMLDFESLTLSKNWNSRVLEIKEVADVLTPGDYAQGYEAFYVTDPSGASLDDKIAASLVIVLKDSFEIENYVECVVRSNTLIMVVETDTANKMASSDTLIRLSLPDSNTQVYQIYVRGRLIQLTNVKDVQ